jgi:hypothetical protein
MSNICNLQNYMTFQKKNFVDGSFLLTEKFKDNKPFAAGKIGNGELMCIYNYFICQHKNLHPIQWSPTVVTEIYNNAGVFPQTEEARIDFINETIDSIKDIDCLAHWSMFNLDFEGRFIKKHSPNCDLIDLQSLEPFYFGHPWTQFLKNKDVLVITPFVKSVEQQYKKRLHIWRDERMLPAFNLHTLKHPYSPGIDKPSNYSSWKNMIQDFKSKMDNIQYDVAIIGTGASSLPLVAHAKRQGKKAIHLGGGLQIMFGIKGSRWDNNIGSFFYNEHWARPLSEEIPEKYKFIENGCYW